MKKKNICLIAMAILLVLTIGALVTLSSWAAI